MKITLLSLFILLTQPVDMFNHLTITNEDEPIAKVERNDFTLPYLNQPFINMKDLNQLIEQLSTQVYKKPIDATLNWQGQIISEQVGYMLNRKQFTEKLYAYLYENRFNEVEIPRLTLYPKVDSELLSAIHVKKIGQYMTYYNAGNEERSHNILLATEAINNKVVFPGEKFSFNQVVGKRTKEKGYLPAPVIVKGELSEGIGGGICQVSSTLFNAIDNAGVPILERYSHSRSVPYVPPGRDATVSWYGPDFIFQNNYNQPILIRARSIEGKVIITVYSSETINLKQREIPSAPEKLPKEVRIESGLNTGSDTSE